MNIAAQPAKLESVEQLDEVMSRPTAGVIETLRALPGDVLLLGVGGKMGPTIARMARRALEAIGSPHRVIGVSRFSNTRSRHELEQHGVSTVSADLLDSRQVAALPDCPLVIYLVGQKFGTQGGEANTWAMNVAVPTLVADRFRGSRVVALSSGNVYGLAPVASGGSRETDVPQPVGEYAMSVLGRERIFEYFSRAAGMPCALIRLNYAVEMRYGVLVDVAARVWSRQPLDISMGHANVIWQGDACAAVLQALATTASPPSLWNLTGSETLSIAETARQFGQIMDRSPVLVGSPQPDAVLSNTTRAAARFGPYQVSLDQLIAWTANWIMQGRELLGKPTHFENRTGNF